MPSTSWPLVSIVTLNYNQAVVTKEFLESSRKLTYPKYEIIVCDMASTDDISNVVHPEEFAHTKLYKSKENLGFAGGNNWGMKHANGEFIFIVNNDTEVTPDLIQHLIEPFLKDEEIGVTCPKIKYFDQPDIIQYAGFNPMNNVTGRTSAIGEKEKDLGQYDVSGPTNGSHGCAMMVKKEVIKKVGMFPEKFFLYYEEWDWSARIMKAGYKIWYSADAVIYHKESMTVGKNNPLKVYYHTRNRILYMRRNTGIFQLIIFWLFFIFISIPKAVIVFLLRRQFIQLKYFLKGVAWNLSSSSYSAVN